VGDPIAPQLSAGHMSRLSSDRRERAVTVFFSLSLFLARTKVRHLSVSTSTTVISQPRDIKRCAVACGSLIHEQGEWAIPLPRNCPRGICPASRMSAANGRLKNSFSAYNPDFAGENTALSLPCEITPKAFKRSEFHWGQKTGFCGAYNDI